MELASMLCSNSGNSSISHPPPWPCFSDMNQCRHDLLQQLYLLLLACLLFVIEVLEVGCLIKSDPMSLRMDQAFGD
jgi:hypothetical protein